MRQSVSVGTVAVLAFTAICLGTVACGNREPNSSSVVRIAVPGDERLFLSSPARDLVFLPLFGSSGSGDRFTTGLVEKAEFSADGRDGVLHIRPGLRWHDGHPVTAEDLEHSFRTLLTGTIEDCGETTVLDSLTIRVRDLDCGGDETHMPKHLTQDLDPEEIASWDFWRNPVGNGPYKVVRYVPRTGFELEANPDYFLGKPPIDRLIVTFVPPAAALNELLARSVDISVGSSAWVDALGPDSPYRPYYDFSRSWVQSALFWQSRNPLFSDASVRRALTMAIDRKALVAARHYSPDIVPVVDGPWSGTAMRFGNHPPLIPFAPDSARVLLEEDGWIDSNGDGIRERGGEPFQFTMLMTASREYETLGLLVQDNLAEVGVHAELQPLTGSVLSQLVRAGDYEAVLMGNAYGLSRRWDIGWDDSEYRELGVELEFVQEPERIAELYERRIEILQRDVPLTTFYTRPGVVFVHERIKGLSNFGWASVFKVMGQLWIEEGPEGEKGTTPGGGIR